MCHHTTIHKAAHLSPIGLMGPVRTGPYFLALANILHPYRVGDRGVLWTPTSENPKKKQISSIELPEIGLLRSCPERHYEGSPFSPSSPTALSHICPSVVCIQVSYSPPAFFCAPRFFLYFLQRIAVMMASHRPALCRPPCLTARIVSHLLVAECMPSCVHRATRFNTIATRCRDVPPRTSLLPLFSAGIRRCCSRSHQGGSFLSRQLSRPCPCLGTHLSTLSLVVLPLSCSNQSVRS
jgi:hypothetical protein